MKRLSKARFLSTLAAAAKKKRVPQYVTFELSYGCNLSCLHCFNPTHAASRRELTTPEIFRILGELAEIGVYDVCFTGGEPLLRPDLFEILEKAKSLGLSVSLNTNATRLTPERARRLESLGLSGLYVSVYGATREVYESVTEIPGSHARFVDGLDALAETTIPVTLQMPVLTLNRGDVAASKALALARGFKFLPTVEIYPRQDGDPGPLRWRLPPAEQLSTMQELGTLAATSSHCAADGQAFVDCDCGKTQFAITPFGEMNLCTIFPIPKFDLRKGGVREGWEALKRVVDEAAPNENYECPSCEVKTHCRQGRADSWLEKKDLSVCLPHYKELATLEKNLDAVSDLAR